MAAGVGFRTLMARLREGDGDAASALFERFARQVMRVAARQLPPHLRAKVDPEDVTQSVFGSFFRRQRRGDFECANWDNLWGLLEAITLNKCRRRLRHLQAACRDARRETSYEAAGRPAGRGSRPRDPTPVEAAVLSEMVDHLMRGLDESDREIASFQLQGCVSEEIAARVGGAARSVRRVMDRVRRRLRDIQDAGGRR